MYFNGFFPTQASTLPSWGQTPVAGGYRPGNWFGGGFGGFGGWGNWMGHWSMGQSSNWMSQWWQRPQWRPPQHHHHHHHHHHHPEWPSSAGWRPVPPDVSKPETPAASTTPTAPAAPAAPAAAREGAWDASKGGYVVGQSGELKLDIKWPKENYPIQYRATDGTWTDLGGSKDLMNAGGTTIKAAPGSTIEFRIKNGSEWYRAGTTANVDGRDHGKVTTTGTGFRVAFDDYKWGGSYDDVYFDLSDPKAKG